MMVRMSSLVSRKDYKERKRCTCELLWLSSTRQPAIALFGNGRCIEMPRCWHVHYRHVAQTGSLNTLTTSVKITMVLVLEGTVCVQSTVVEKQTEGCTVVAAPVTSLLGRDFPEREGTTSRLFYAVLEYPFYLSHFPAHSRSLRPTSVYNHS